MGFIQKITGSFLVCSSFFLFAEEDRGTTEMNKALDSVVRIFEKKMEGKFGLTCCMSGASMPEDIQSIDIGFESKKIATLEEARKVAVFFMEQFLSIINEDEKVRPYLREYPFPRKRVFMTFSFRQGDNSEGRLHLYLVKDQIAYRSCKEPLEKGVEILRESYEEALQQVRKK
jgi:hypothetical protein